MDVQIVAALIGGIAIVVASVITAIVSKRGARGERKRREEAERASGSSSRGLERELEYRYGFKAGLVLTRMEMTDLDGAVEVQRTWQELRVASGGVPIAGIPGRVWVQHSEGKITRLPDLVRPVNFPKAVDLRNTSVSDRQCEFRIEITGWLTDADPPLTCTFITGYAKGVCVTKEEMDKAYERDEFKKEYHSLDVTMPIDVLEIQVVFPDGYLFDPYPAVFYGHTETPYDPELQRIKTGFRRAGNSAFLKVESPLVGFRYLIYWIPSTVHQLARLSGG